MVEDREEQQRIRAHFETEPGKGLIIEQLMGERENALRLGDDSAVLRTEDQLAGFGYQTPEQREDAAKARKADAERRDRERKRIEENRGPAAAHDDHAGDTVTQHAGVVDEHGSPMPGGDEPEGQAEKDDGKTPARRKPPAGRGTRQGKQQEG